VLLFAKLLCNRKFSEAIIPILNLKTKLKGKQLQIILNKPQSHLKTNHPPSTFVNLTRFVVGGFIGMKKFVLIAGLLLVASNGWAVETSNTNDTQHDYLPLGIGNFKK